MKKVFLLTSLVVMAFTGSIFATIGYESTLSRVNATPFVGQLQEYNNAGASGVFDTTFGSLNIDSLLPGGQVRSIQTLPNGDFLTVSSVAGSASKVVMYNSQGTLQASTSLGSAGLSNVALASMIDAQGRLLVAGGANSGTAGWIYRVNTAVTSAIPFTTNSAWQYIGGLAEQSTGNIIAVGFSGTGPASAQIGRYKLDGTIDTSFGTLGFVTLNGSGLLLPTVRTIGLGSVTIDTQDNIYVAFVASASANGFTGGNAYLVRFIPGGGFDTDWGIVGLPALNGATSQLLIAQDVNGNFIVAGNVTEGPSTQIIVTAINSSGAALGGFTNFDSSTLGVFASFLVGNIITTQDGSILIGGTCNFTGAPLLAIIKLIGATGDLDSTFNTYNLATNPSGTNGYNLFYNGGTAPGSQAIVTSMALAPDGRLYTADVQLNVGITTSYISRLYNTPYDSQVSQSPPAQEQGVFDTTFGTAVVSPNLQSVRGVTMPYNGNFGQSLQQQTRGIVQAAIGDVLVGSDGYTGSSPYKTMMLTWLTSTGTLDTTFGINGQLFLPNVSGLDETMAALTISFSPFIYIAGSTGTPTTFIRSYDHLGTPITSNLTDTGIAAVGIAIQGDAGILLFAQDSSVAGHITRYISTAGVLSLDENFGPTSSGSITSTQLGLNMGPVYGGGLVNRAGNIIINYVNSSTGYVNVAMINKNGTALISEFGTTGVASPFGSATLSASSVRIAFDSNIDENIYVAAVSQDGLQYLMTRLDGITGQVDPTFNNGFILSISPESDVTALTLTNLTGVNNGTVMLTGYDAATNPVMLMMRVATANNVASLDVTFNSQGAVPGVVSLQIENETANYSARIATGLVIQTSNGSPLPLLPVPPIITSGSSGTSEGGRPLSPVGYPNLIYSAYEQQTSSQSTPEIFRLCGQLGTVQVERFPLQDQNPGTLDISLNGCGALDIAALTTNSVANVVYAYPVGNLHEGKVLLGVDNGTSIYIIRVDETLVTLDPTFAPETAGLYTIAGLTGLQNIMVDVHNRIIINGSLPSRTAQRSSSIPSPLAWVQRIPENGDSAPTLFNMPVNIITANMVYQQESGRYIVAGSTHVAGIMLAFQDVVVAPATGLAVDVTFNPLGLIPGLFVIPQATALYSLAINSDDTIYTAYKDTSTGYLTIAQVLANGANLDNAFNDTGLLATPITPDSAEVIRVVVDSNQNVIVAASCGAGTSLEAFRCDVTGNAITAFFGDGVSGAGVFSTTLASSNGITLQALLEDLNGKTILIGSTSDNSDLDANGTIFAVRLSTAGPLDSIWNPSSNSPDVSGILTFGAVGNPLTQAITIMSNATINIAGNILAVGGNGTDAILMEIVGDSFVTGVEQGQLEVAAGILDTTLSEPSGSLDLVTADLVVTGYTPDKLYIYPNGSMLIGTSNGTSTTLTQVDATLALDSSFNLGAILSLGVGTANLNDMFVANAYGQDGTIYVTGSTSGAALWSGSVTSDGLSFSTNAVIAGWTMGTAIRLAGNGDMMVAGFNGTYGAVAAFLPNGVTLDPLFGNSNGVYATGSSNPISAMTIDGLSRIYIAYIDSTIPRNINIQRLTPGGTIDPIFGTAIMSGTTWNPLQIKLSLDEVNHQLVVVGQDGAGLSNTLKVARFSTINGSSTGTLYTTPDVSISGKLLTLSDLFIDTNQEIYVIGTNITDNRAVVARLMSTSSTTIALDSNYAAGITPAPAGVANLAIPSLTFIGAGALDPDRRVYLVGTDLFGSGNAYMARVFGNNYYAQVSQAISSVALGELDYTYGTAGVATNYANGASSASAGQEARAIVPLAVGTDSMTIIGDGVNSWTVRLLSDGTNDPTYGGGQGITIAKQTSGNEIVQGMVFDSSGNTIVFGSNSVAGGFIKSILPSGSMNQGFGGGTGYVYISQFDLVNAVAQLSNNNFVVVGSQAGVGKIGMLYSDGTIFNIISLGINVTSVSVDSLDNIYVSFATTASSVMSACVAKCDATGVSPLFDLSYGVNGIAANVMTNLDSAANIRLVLDVSGQVVVAASGDGSSGSVGLIRLNLDGSIDESFNTTDIPFGVGTSGVVTSLSALQNGNYYVAGYQYDSNDADNNDYEFVAAVTSTGALDINFNAIGQVPGLLTFQVAAGEQTGRNVWGMGITYNGQILLAGSEGPESGGEIPLTMQVNGYRGVRAVPQFTGSVPVIPSDINSTFGIAFTMPDMSNLVEGGCTAVDSRSRVLVGGRTATPNTFVVARFLTDGILDPDFGIVGIAQTPELTTLMSGSFITLDNSDNVYIGGITTDNAFIVAKFLSSTGNLDTVGFNPSAVSPLVPGVAESLTTANVISGGYLTIDYIENVIVGGISADQKLSIARFTSMGAQDPGFGIGGVAQTPVIPTLHNGGFVATAIAAPDLFPDLNDNSIYVGASTFADTLIIAKFNRLGVLDTDTWNSSSTTPGIAETAMIANLIDGGSLSLDKDRIVAIGGYTSDQTFVAAKFFPTGLYVPQFGTDGIAFSSPLLSIDSFGSLAIDSNNNVLLGGISTAYDGISKSMVVARLTPIGLVDNSFGTVGISTTGTIANLVNGGFVSVNVLNNVLVGGYDGTKLVVAQLYSGGEFFIANPSSLPAFVAMLSLYGNDLQRFKHILGLDSFAQIITDPANQALLQAHVSASLDAYALAGGGSVGFNLACSLLQIWSLQLDRLQALLILEGLDTAQVNEFFVALRARATFLNHSLGAYSNRA